MHSTGVLVIDSLIGSAPTPTAGTPRATSPTGSPQLQPQGPTQLLTALLARLPDATNRAMIDEAAVDFAFLNSKAARKRLVKFLSQVQKNRTDLLPHYSRLVAILNRYMPDIGNELVQVVSIYGFQMHLLLRLCFSWTKSSAIYSGRRRW